MNRHFRRILAVILCLVMISFAACSTQNSGESGSTPASQAESSREDPQPSSSGEEQPASDPEPDSSDSSGEPSPSDTEYAFEALPDGTAALTKYTGSEENPVTPQTIGGMDVTAVSDGCFEGLLGIRSVTVSQGVRRVGDYAFECCTDLVSVTLPETLLEIGEGAFSGCINLEELVLPSVETIGRGAFLYAKKLPGIMFPSNLASMGEFAFANCSSLSQADFADAVITQLPDRAFYGCAKLASVTLPKNLASAGKRAFSGCGALTSLSFPNAMPVSEYMLENCGALENLALDAQELGKGAFTGCSSLKSVSLENVSRIGYAAFSGTGIESVIIPASVKTVDGGAFFNSNIASLSFEEGSDFRIEDGAVIGSGGTVLIAYINSDTDYEGIEEFRVPDGVEIIGDYAFATARIGKVILPNSVRQIGAYAFRYSTVTELEMPDGVETDPNAFTESGLDQGGNSDYVPSGETVIDELGSYAKENSLFDEEEFRDYREISNDEFDAWSEEYLAFCEESGCPLNYDTMHYIMLYKGEVIPHFLGMTCVQNRDPQMWEEAANAFGDDFEQMYLMMDHGLFTELRRGKMPENLVLYTGVYDSQLMAAAGTDEVPTMEQLTASVGNIFSDPIMTSTTTDPQIASNFGETLFIIYASKEAISDLGAVCIDAAAHTNEKEILMCENAQYEILDVGAFRIEMNDGDGFGVDRYYLKLRLLGKAS